MIESISSVSSCEMPDTRLTRDRRESGQTLVEFALVLMFVILPFTFVLIDGAMTLYTWAALTNTVREGARAGSIYQTTTPPDYTQTLAQQAAAIDSARATFILQELQGKVGPLVPFSDCAATIGYSPSAPTLGDPYRAQDALSVSLACPRSLFFGLIGSTQITLTAQSTMKIEPGGVAPTP